MAEKSKAVRTEGCDWTGARISLSSKLQKATTSEVRPERTSRQQASAAIVVSAGRTSRSMQIRQGKAMPLALRFVGYRPKMQSNN